jgi:hypothetical protein
MTDLSILIPAYNEETTVAASIERALAAELPVAERELIVVENGTYTAILDADLEYEAADLGPLLEPLLAGEADAAIGSRVFHSHSAYGYWYVVGGRALSTAASMLFNAWLSDVLCCLKLAPTGLLRSLDLRATGFTIDAEIPARLLRAGKRIYEVPVSYTARPREQGKKLTAADGVRILATLLRCRFDRWSLQR